MMRLLLVCLLSVLIAFSAMALVKVFVVCVVIVFYGGHYQWGMDDFMFVVKQGSLMAIVFCTFATVHFFRNRRQ
jgi:hypothetical protein